MKYRLYSVRDEKVEAFMAPFVARTDGEATRSFVDAAKDRNKFASHPEDYNLFCLGVYDDANGIINGDDYAGFVPKLIMTGVEASAFDGR